jgi:hypothetical protein
MARSGIENHLKQQGFQIALRIVTYITPLACLFLV